MQTAHAFSAVPDFPAKGLQDGVRQGKLGFVLAQQSSDGYGPENASLQIDASLRLAGRSKNSWTCTLHGPTSL